MTGMMFDIQRGSVVDGPGVRTTVFFKGCNLRCKWCHNPESQQMQPQMMFYESKCIRCGKCEQVCPHGLKSCSFCGQCELYCPRSARRICGRAYTEREVMEQIVRDKAFYDDSGGGATFSGGECMLQTEFLTALLRLCRAEGIHTAVDTAGDVPWSYFEQVLPYTDLFLYDIKCMDARLHKEMTGVSNERILENIEKLAARARVLVRVPVIPSVNDKDWEIEAIAALLRRIGVQEVEALAYHSMGENKYAALGLPCTQYEAPSEEKMKRIKDMLHSGFSH